MEARVEQRGADDTTTKEAQQGTSGELPIRRETAAGDGVSEKASTAAAKSPARESFRRNKAQAALALIRGGTSVGPPDAAAGEAKHQEQNDSVLVSGDERATATTDNIASSLDGVEDDTIWTEIQGPFLAVGALKTDTKSAPLCHLNDGCMDVVAVPDMSFPSLVQICSKFPEHIHDDRIIFIKAVALRLIPDVDTECPVNVDGEPLPGLPFNLRVLPGALRVVRSLVAMSDPEQ